MTRKASKTFLSAVLMMCTVSFVYPLPGVAQLPSVLDLALPNTADQILFNADNGDTRLSGQQVTQSVATGDVNGDGIKDILVSAPVAQGPNNRRQSAGEVLVFLGREDSSNQTVLRDAATEPPPAGSGADVIIFGPALSSLGTSLASGDINGDGLDDIIMGAQSAGKPAIGGMPMAPVAGAVFVVYGSTDFNAGTRIDLLEDEDVISLAAYGPHSLALTGFSVAVGHLNNDLIADLIIGSPGANKAGVARAFGAAYVIFGQVGLAGIRDLSAAPASGLGPDVAVFGADASGRTSGDQLGVAVTAGDINGDGIGDLIVSAPLSDGLNNRKQDSGDVYVLFGGAGLAGGTTVDLAETPASVTIYGAAGDDQIGLSLATGDVNGDEVADLLIGAPNKNAPAGSGAGVAYVVFGHQMLAAGSIRDLSQAAPDGPDVIVNGPARRSALGVSVGSGDINLDRIDDIIVGADGAPGHAGDQTGAVFLFYGTRVLTRGQTFETGAGAAQGQGPSVSILGIDANDRLGFNVATGDVNGDFIDDLLMTAPGGDGPDNNRSNSGETYLLEGER